MEIVKLFAECIEAVAMLEAERIGFNMEVEKHALMRMIMTVLSSKDLRREALDLLQTKIDSQPPQ